MDNPIFFQKNIKSISIIFIIIFSLSCKSNKISENIILKIDSIKTINNEILLLNSDYIIIEYIENNELEIEIINFEKIMQVKKLSTEINPMDLIYFNPIIYINIQGKEYLSKGMWALSSAVPQDCDFIFNYILDENGKILFMINNNIVFRKWR